MKVYVFKECEHRICSCSMDESTSPINSLYNVYGKDKIFVSHADAVELEKELDILRRAVQKANDVWITKSAVNECRKQEFLDILSWSKK